MIAVSSTRFMTAKRMSASRSFNRNDGSSIVVAGESTVRFVHVIATESVKILGESESNGLLLAGRPFRSVVGEDVVRPRGFEPLTFCSGGKHAVELDN